MSQLHSENGPSHSRVQEIVDRFAGDLSVESLYRGVHTNIGLENLGELLTTGSVGFYKIAQDLIKRNIKEVQLQENLARLVKEESDGVFPLLRILAALPLPKSTLLEDALIERAFNGSPIVSEAAAKVLALRYKAHIPTLLENHTPGIRLGLAYSQDSSLVEPLLAAWGVTDDPECNIRPPIGLGLLLNQYLLADIWERKPHLGRALATAYGYIDDAIDTLDSTTVDHFCKLLRMGFMSVDIGLLAAEPEELRMIENQFLRTLMPWSTGMTGGVPSEFDPSDKVWQTLFLGAVRESEFTNFDLKSDELPYTETGQQNVKWAEFSYTPMSYARRELLHKPIQEFNARSIPQELLPEYLLEYAVCRLERDVRAQEEQMLFFEARWALVAQQRKAPAPIVNFPITSFEDAHELRELVLPKRPLLPLPFTESASLAGDSVQKLLQYTGRNQLCSLIPKLDTHFRSILPTIGIEIQCPFTKNRREQSVAWKQALRSFNIPSPRRPEYGQMVEASFSPGYSFQMHVAAILLLREIGLFQSGPDCALHVSLSGRLGTEVRYILFPQQCIQRPSSSPPGAWLMSKGFAHQHEDAIDPIGSRTARIPLPRTEIRSMRIINDNLVHSDLPDCLDDIACIHLLGGALGSNIPSLQAIWAAYKAAIDSAVASLPATMQNWFHADWYERVGDSFDKRLMHTLPFMKTREAALQWMNAESQRDALRDSFLQIRNTHARAVFDALPRLSVYGEFPEYFNMSPAGIPLFNPAKELPPYE